MVIASAEGHAGQPRFSVYAYVCSVTDVKRTDQDPPPSATFTQIYQQRPKDCRYAIIGFRGRIKNGEAVWSAWDYDERFFAIDLLEVEERLATGDVIVPDPRLEHHNLNAAIMATVLLYNKEKRSDVDNH